MAATRLIPMHVNKGKNLAQSLGNRTDYAKIDSQYSTTKAERKAAKQKIKQAEKKIKNLDRAKKKIKVNFEQKNNI